MTNGATTGDGDSVLTLQALIQARMADRGWTYAELGRRSGDVVTDRRWQQFGAGERLRELPKKDSLRRMAEVLEVDFTTVLLAAAATAGLPVRPRGSDLAQLLPAGTDRLSEGMRDAILAIIRAAVSDTLGRDDADSEDAPDLVSYGPAAKATLGWPKSDAPSRRGAVRNTVRRTAETE